MKRTDAKRRGEGGGDPAQGGASGDAHRPSIGVSRETGGAELNAKLAALARRYSLSAGQLTRLRHLLDALATEPNPPTTVREPIAAAEVHVADSLAGLEVEGLTRAARIVDIGAGAGFPGLVLAVALARSRVDLLEANRRKSAVIERLARAAGIDNAQAFPARAEEWSSAAGFTPYEAATARAVSTLAVLVEYGAPLLALGGVLVAWKGRVAATEREAGRRAAAEVGLMEAGIVPVRPYSDSLAKTLYVYSKVSATPPRFPRRAGMAAKRPLA